ALAVDLERAALADEVHAEGAAAERGGDGRGDAIVAGHEVLPAPAVEAEAGGAERARLVEEEAGRGVAGPRIAVGHHVEALFGHVVERVRYGARRRLVGDEELERLAG